MDIYSMDEAYYAIEQEMTKEEVFLLKLEFEGDMYEDKLLDVDCLKHGTPPRSSQIFVGNLEVNVNKYICQIHGEYYTVEADNLHQAMVAALIDGGTVIGEYTKYAHLFNE